MGRELYIPVIPETQELKQEDYKVTSGLGYMARLCLKNQKENYRLNGGTYSLMCPDISKGSLNCGIMNQTDVCFYLTLHCYLLPSREELNHSLLEFMVNRVTEASTVTESVA